MCAESHDYPVEITGSSDLAGAEHPKSRALRNVGKLDAQNLLANGLVTGQSRGRCQAIFDKVEMRMAFLIRRHLWKWIHIQQLPLVGESSSAGLPLVSCSSTFLLRSRGGGPLVKSFSAVSMWSVRFGSIHAQANAFFVASAIFFGFGGGHSDGCAGVGGTGGTELQRRTDLLAVFAIFNMSAPATRKIETRTR